MTILAPIRQHVEALAAERGYPAAAIEACIARPAEALPLLRASLQRAARGLPTSEAEAAQLFLGLHILAKLRDEQSFPTLMRLLCQPFDKVDALLGDVVTASLQRIVASLFDGDVDALFEIVGDASIDEYIRNALWEAATTLAFRGRIDRERMRAEIVRFGEERPAPKGDMAWLGWVNAITVLGYDDLAAANSSVWIDQRLPPDCLSRAEADRDLAEALSAPDDAGRLEKLGLGTIDDIAQVLHWVEWDGPPAPIVNPMRNVGRNDPCPCGSGKKAKKCCLAG